VPALASEEQVTCAAFTSEEQVTCAALCTRSPWGEGWGEGRVLAESLIPVTPAKGPAPLPVTCR